MTNESTIEAMARAMETLIHLLHEVPLIKAAQAAYEASGIQALQEENARLKTKLALEREYAFTAGCINGWNAVVSCKPHEYLLDKVKRRDIAKAALAQEGE